MQIQVNGESRATREGATIADVLSELQIRPDRVAVEVNLEIVAREEFSRHGLRQGDRIEIISFIGGGEEEFDDLAIFRFGDLLKDELSRGLCSNRSILLQSSNQQIDKSTNQQINKFWSRPCLPID